MRHDEEHGPQEGGTGFDMGWIDSLYIEQHELFSDPRISPWMIEDLSFMAPTWVVSTD